MEQPEKYSTTFKIEHSPARFNYSVSKSFDFSTQNQLEKMLDLSIDKTSLSFSDYFTDPLKVIRNWLNPRLTLTIEVDGDNQPEFLEDALRHIGKRHANIGTIVLQNTKNEDPYIKQLEKRLANGLQSRDGEIYRRYSKMRNAAIIPILLGTLVFALGAAPFVVANYILREAFTGMLFVAARQWYLDFAAKYYAKKQNINEITDRQVITALEKGARSISWGSYLLSFFSYSAWRHPLAAAAGLELASRNKEKIVNIIHEKYAPLPTLAERSNALIAAIIKKDEAFAISYIGNDFIKNNITVCEKALMAAARVNASQRLINTLLEGTTLKDYKDHFKLKALVVAVEYGHFALANKLLESDVVKNNAAPAIRKYLTKVNALFKLDPTKVDIIALRSNYGSLLNQAAEWGHLSVINKLLEFPTVQKNIAANDNSAFRLAVKNGHLPVVKRLLEFKAVKNNIAAKNNEAFKMAAHNERIDIMRTLLANGAVVREAKVDIDDIYNQAKSNKRILVASELRKYFAIPDVGPSASTRLYNRLFNFRN